MVCHICATRISPATGHTLKADGQIVCGLCTAEARAPMAWDTPWQDAPPVVLNLQQVAYYGD